MAFFSETVDHFSNLKISKKKFQKTILGLKFKFPAHNSKVFLAGNLNFKFRIVFWNIFFFFGDLKNESHFLKKATFNMTELHTFLSWYYKRTVQHQNNLLGILPSPKAILFVHIETMIFFPKSAVSFHFRVRSVWIRMITQKKFEYVPFMKQLCNLNCLFNLANAHL